MQHNTLHACNVCVAHPFTYREGYGRIFKGNMAWEKKGCIMAIATQRFCMQTLSQALGGLSEAARLGKGGDVRCQGKQNKTGRTQSKVGWVV
jgi:hypothetical protein